MTLDQSNKARLDRLEKAVEALQKVSKPTTSDGSFTSLKEKLSRLDAHIRFEFDLTAQRVAYLATSQAFMFAAYTTATLNLQNQNGADAVAELDLKRQVLQRIVYFVPRFGITLSLVVLAAVVSACIMSLILKKQRHALREQVAQHQLDVDMRVEHLSWQHWVGWLPPITVSAGLAVGWLYVHGWLF